MNSLVLASRVASLIQLGRRESTYKLALLMALIDISVETEPDLDGSLPVGIDELTHRVIAYYWPQARTFHEHGRLRQTKTGSSIPDRVSTARNQLAQAGLRTPEAAREANHPAYSQLVRSIRLTIGQQPLTHLQTVPRAAREVTTDDFLFDASRFHKKMTISELAQADPIRLRPGVAQALREAAPLLKTMIRSLWTADVIRLNRSVLDDDDLEGFLFADPRTALNTLRDPLIDLQNGRCFYCHKNLKAVHIDHVLPWSLVPINGIANLVAIDPACNSDKSASVPIPDHTERAITRTGLDDVADLCKFPVLRDRTRAAAHGIYTSLPNGTPLWSQVRQYTPAQRPATQRFLPDVHHPRGHPDQSQSAHVQVAAAEPSISL